MTLAVGRLVPWLWFTGCLASAVLFLCTATVFLNSDMSSELILSKLIAEEGNWVFSDNWFYSTELRVLNMQIIWAALFRFAEDWYFVRIVGTIFAYVLYLACFRFFLVEAGWKRIFPWAGGALLLPLSLQYAS